MEIVVEADRAAFMTILQELQSTWNAGDGVAFGAPMAEDADFVLIRTDHLRGRQAIIASHRGIFSTSSSGSHNQLSLEAVRMLDENVGLIHVGSVLDAPTGPLAGTREAIFSAVLLRKHGRWQITSFHITHAPSHPA